MTHVEQRTFLPAVVERSPASKTELPKLQVDRALLTEQGYQAAGIGIILLGTNPYGDVFLALGKHNSTDRTSQGLWSWFGETLKEDDAGNIEPSDNAVVRCFEEELGISADAIDDLGLHVNAGKLFSEVDLTAHKVVSGTPIKYRIAAHVFWINDTSALPVVCTEEIDGLELFPLSEVATGRTKVPLREFTSPVVVDLYNQGLLDYPGSDRLSKLSIPKTQSSFSHSHADLTV